MMYINIAVIIRGLHTEYFVHFVTCFLYEQPLFTMKAQRRFLEQSITEDMYDELIEKYKSEEQVH